MVMKVPENEEQQYENRHDGRTETAPYCGKTSLHIMQMVGFRITLNTITKLFVNTMFHSMMAPRTVLVEYYFELIEVIMF